MSINLGTPPLPPKKARYDLKVVFRICFLSDSGFEAWELRTEVELFRGGVSGVNVPCQLSMQLLPFPPKP